MSKSLPVVLQTFTKALFSLALSQLQNTFVLFKLFKQTL